MKHDAGLMGEGASSKKSNTMVIILSIEASVAFPEIFFNIICCVIWTYRHLKCIDEAQFILSNVLCYRTLTLSFVILIYFGMEKNSIKLIWYSVWTMDTALWSLVLLCKSESLVEKNSSSMDKWLNTSSLGWQLQRGI